MATTTNYGWTTPDDTALVKDGAAAIRTLGSSVDTTTKNLNPETTLGDISYRSSTANVNTRLPLGTAGQVLKVNSGATAPEWATDATGMTNPMTTTGDTIYSSSGSTPARLGIGTAGQVLKVNSGATAPEWAAPASANLDIDVILSGSLSSSGISLTGLTQNYLQLRISGAATAGSSTANFTCTVNSDTSGIYFINAWENYSYTTDILAQNSANNWRLNTSAIYTNANNNNYIITIFNCAASGYHNVLINGTHRQSDNANLVFFMAQGYVKTTAAITSIQFDTTGASFNAGTYELIGG